MKLSRISRIVQLLTTLQSGQSYGPDKLAGLLGVSRRTVFRDLKELAVVGVPLRFDTRAGGYKIDPKFFLPPIDLNLQEALSLLLLVHEGCNHLPIPFKNSALLGGLKIESNLPSNLKRYCNTALQHVSIRPIAHAPAEQLDKFFGQLQTAIRKTKKVRMLYDSLSEDVDIELTLDPYHLMYNRRAWYILGFSNMHNEVRTFKLNRIKSLTVLERCFLRDDGWDVQEYLGRAWSMIPEGRIYDVKLRFSPKVARKVSFNEDGSAEVEFRVDGLGEIRWWILGYGDEVEVLRPAALRKRIACVAERMLEQNAAT
jgi:predicted DNA-binding transcriptional regulator YafY